MIVQGGESVGMGMGGKSFASVVHTEGYPEARINGVCL